ncbi:MAG: TlpA family protein disulfide reductase [Burkholderiales bacterium]|nr:TlpA family protein disulfide reductase [Burkholderiales bacterium]
MKTTVSAYRSFARLLLLTGLLLLNASLAAAELKEGEGAPAFSAVLLDGATFDSASHRGKVIVLNFWASWCKPCRHEMPALDAYYRAHRAEGLEMVAISVEAPDELDRVMRTMKGYSFPAAIAANAETKGYGQLWRLPVTFVIDRRGVLRFDGLKFAKAMDLPTLEKIVTPLLRESANAKLAASDQASSH